jgi:DNA-binding transcriptional LysR family regulator
LRGRHARRCGTSIVCRDPIVAIMHPSHSLASRAKLKLRDLADQPVALLDNTHFSRVVLDKALALGNVSGPF